MRLATFNILNGRSTKDGTVRLDRLARAVRGLDADILGMQEVDRLQERSHRADLTAVAAEAMGARSHRFTAALSGTAGATWVAATGNATPDGAAYGIALLAKYPVLNWQVLRLPRIPMRFPMWLPGPRKVIVVQTSRGPSSSARSALPPATSPSPTPTCRSCPVGAAISCVGWCGTCAYSPIRSC